MSLNAERKCNEFSNNKLMVNIHKTSIRFSLGILKNLELISGNG